MAPPAFIRGQWTQYGTGSVANATWRVGETGVGGQPPYDALLTSAGGLTTFPSSAIGMTLGAARGGTSGENSVFTTWGPTFVFDTSRKRLILGCWGGDQGETSNEIDEWDWATGTWNPDGRPVNPTTRLLVQNGTNWPAAWLPLGAGHPTGPECVWDKNNDYPNNAKLSHQFGLRLYPKGGHNYGGCCWMPSVGRYFRWGAGGDWGAGTDDFRVVEYDPSTKKFEVIDTPDCSSFGGGVFFEAGGGVLPSACWDSINNRVIFINQVGLWPYYPSNAYGNRIPVQLADDLTGRSGGGFSMVFIPTKNWVWIFGGNWGYTQYDFSGGNTNTPVKSSLTFTGDTLAANGEGPAICYDPVGDKVAFWVGGKVISMIDPTTKVITNVGASSPVDPGPGGGVLSHPQAWGRLVYVPGDDVFFTLNDVTSAGVFVYAPVRTTTPVLAFTDIVAGPSTGNGDTSFGASAGVDGAYVTIFTLTPIASTDTVTVTINGAAALVVDKGRALPPHCAATLYNNYQKLHCVVAQVSHLATTGAGVIHVTVNGVVDTGAGLPFTVQTGTIQFVTTAGNDSTGTGTWAAPYRTITKAVALIASGDIFYIGDGVTLAGGSVVPQGSVSPTKAMAIVAYPNAAVTVGDGTHDAFGQSFSGSGGLITFSKLALVGAQQIVTIRESSRLIGCTIQAPNGNSLSGAVGAFGSQVVIVGNEFTNCGTSTPASFEAGYHTLYVYGRRNGAASLETTREIGWNYFHDNNAARAINIFNGTDENDAPISLHTVHDNVIVNQEWDGILFGNGVVGVNYAYNNLLINCGLANMDPTGQHVGINIRTSDPPHVTSGQPITVHLYNNTLLNCGDARATDSGAFEFVGFGTMDVRNNIVYQANGLPYLSPNSNQLGAGQSTNNLWFGAGGAPAFDANPVNLNPLLTSATGTYDLHLQTLSPAISAGAVLGFAGTDFDGKGRPSSIAPDIGAYQFAAAAATPTAVPSLRLVFRH